MAALLFLATPGHAENEIRTAAPIKLSTGNGGVKPPVEQPADEATARIVSLVASPSKIPADGKSTSTITATLKDAQGKSIGAGYQVIWWTTMGVIGGPTSLTDAHGVASMTLKSGTYPSHLIVTAQANAVESNVDLEFTNNIGGNGVLPDDAILMNQTASAWAMAADGVSTSVLPVMITDPYGVPVAPGLNVPWSTDSGSLSSQSSLTDANGYATITLTAPSVSGPVTVTANGKWTFSIYT